MEKEVFFSWRGEGGGRAHEMCCAFVVLHWILKWKIFIHLFDFSHLSSFMIIVL